MKGEGFIQRLGWGDGYVSSNCSYGIRCFVCPMIKINISTQTLDYYEDKVLQKSYPISSSINGVGEVEGSFCTPTGQFKISEKIGDKAALGTVFIARIPTGEIYSKQLFNQQADKDWILTRILWLDGVEDHNKNTHERYIYIHGSADEFITGKPQSKGCIRMRNQDIVELFERVQIGEYVAIIEQ